MKAMKLGLIKGISIAALIIPKMPRNLSFFSSLEFFSILILSQRWIFYSFLSKYMATFSNIVMKNGTGPAGGSHFLGNFFFRSSPVLANYLRFGINFQHLTSFTFKFVQHMIGSPS